MKTKINFNDIINLAVALHTASKVMINIMNVGMMMRMIIITTSAEGGR